MKYVIAFVLLISSVCYGATNGAVIIQGIVPKVVSITVAGVAPFNALDLTTTVANLPVANVTEDSNDLAGYTVTLSSANAGSLKNGAAGSMAYTARYNAVVVALTVAPVAITTVASQAAVVNTVKSFTISYTGIPSVSMLSGTYSDALTFTIAAN